MSINIFYINNRKMKMRKSNERNISIIYIIIYLISIIFNLSLNSDLIQSIRQIDNYIEMLNNPIVIIVNIITEIPIVYMRKKKRKRTICNNPLILF